jgi:hypothetical protein
MKPNAAIEGQRPGDKPAINRVKSARRENGTCRKVTGRNSGRRASGSACAPRAVFRASRNTPGHPRRCIHKRAPDVPRGGARHRRRGARAPQKHASFVVFIRLPRVPRAGMWRTSGAQELNR